MRPLLWNSGALFINVVCCLLFVPAEARARQNDPGLNRFVSRPDIRAPKWTVNIHYPNLVSPGYWFVAPREPLGKREQVGPYIGPAIYDNQGELVWSGAPLFKNLMADDFRVSNVNGEKLMTLLYHDDGAGIILDSSYQIRRSVRLGKPRDINIHEFHFVDDGTKALVLRNSRVGATEDDSRSVGLKSGNCIADFDGFDELDATRWGTTFYWKSYGRIGLNESTWTNGLSVEERCTKGWDFLHLNSADKSADGDYFLCARFTDAIYKISKKDGSILWRLGGVMSDFDMGDVKFSGQHNVRYLGENETHTMLSILDNAKIDDLPPTHEISRGLLLALHTTVTPMEVTILSQYEHPHGSGSYAVARGNLQTLPNGNVFIGWSEQATQSEHLSNGTLVMDATLQTRWLGSYRNYKFDFKGAPTDRPAIVSRVHGSGNTEIFVSWNGATEVFSWVFWNVEERYVWSDAITPGSVPRHPLGSVKKSGFETQHVVEGVVKFAFAEAVGRDGEVLGYSVVAGEDAADQFNMQQKGNAQTMENSNTDSEHRAVMDEANLRSFFGGHPIALIIGFHCAAALLLASFVARRKKWFRLLRRPSAPQTARPNDEEVPQSPTTAVRRHRLYT